MVVQSTNHFINDVFVLSYSATSLVLRDCTAAVKKENVSHAADCDKSRQYPHTRADGGKHGNGFSYTATDAPEPPRRME